MEGLNLGQVKQIAIKCLRTVITAIENDAMTDSDKIEFFDTYQDEIVEMLSDKISELKK